MAIHGYLHLRIADPLMAQYIVAGERPSGCAWGPLTHLDTELEH